jgi:hypothetical protein
LFRRDLSSNKITKLPDKLSRLHKLETLCVRRARPPRPPAARPGRAPLGLNDATVSVYYSVLSCNKLEMLPHWIGDLHKLKELWLVDNPALTVLPRQLEECSQLRRVITDAPLQKAAKQVLSIAKAQRDADYFEKYGVEAPAEVSLDSEARRAGDDDDAGGASDGDKSFIQTVSSTCVIQ